MLRCLNEGTPKEEKVRKRKNEKRKIIKSKNQKSSVHQDQKRGNIYFQIS